MSILSDDGLVASSGYSITNSVRCRSAGSTYLSRTPSVTGNRQKFTVSFWAKRAVISGGYQSLFTASGGTLVDTDMFNINFTPSDTLRINGGATDWRITSAVFRDVGAWYHIYVSVDTTTQIINLYVNGVQVTSFGTNNAITSNLQTAVNNTVQHRWGDLNYSTHSYIDAYLSDCYLIDGAALTPTSFGKFDQNGVWVPVKYVGPGNIPVLGSNLIPIMTSDTAPSGTVTCNSEYNGPAWKAFDNDGTTWWASNSSTTGWIAYQFTSNQVVSGYEITNSNLLNQSPTSWTFDGWNGSAWVTLDTRSSISWAALYQTQLFTFTNTTGYIQYRLNITNGSGGGAVTIGSLTMRTTTLNSYGTNGCHLEFKNASALGTDTSGNGNTFTSNGFATSDQVIDTPTNNYATLSPIDENFTGTVTLSNGNTKISLSSSPANQQICRGTLAISVPTYFEVAVNTSSAGVAIGVSSLVSLVTQGSTEAAVGSAAASFWEIIANGRVYNNSAYVSQTAFTSGDIIGVAVNPTTGKLWFSKNGTWMSGDPAAGTSPVYSNLPSICLPVLEVGVNGDTLTANFGQSPFAYTPPTGFKSLCTANLPAVAITKPSNYFNPVLYTGNGGTQFAKTGVGFQPNLVWIKCRSAAYYHTIVDSVRGAINCLRSDQTAAEAAQGLVSLDSDGFTVPGSSQSGYAQINDGQTHVAWNWKKGSTPGFDIQTYTGTGANATFSHSLGAVPTFIIVKARNGTVSAQWHVYHSSLGAGKCMYLSTTDAVTTSALPWNSTAPTSSVFSVGAYTGTNESGKNFIAYLFTDVPGFSKFGSYTGNGSSDGPFVYCGFKPRFVLLRRTDSAGDWLIYDTVRDTYNATTHDLIPDKVSVEGTEAQSLDILSNGFKLRGYNASDFNTSGGTFIYAAFAEGPFGGSNVSPATAR